MLKEDEAAEEEEQADRKVLQVQKALPAQKDLLVQKHHRYVPLSLQIRRKQSFRKQVAMDSNTPLQHTSQVKCHQAGAKMRKLQQLLILHTKL